jgi:hypothetical protein
VGSLEQASSRSAPKTTPVIEPVRPAIGER